VLRVPQHELDLLVGELAHHAPGRAHHQRAVGDLLALGDEGVGADDALPADPGVVEDDRLDADQAALAHAAAVQHGHVADGAVAPDVELNPGVGVQHRPVLMLSGRPP
jgi:hypothetical protein